MSTGVRLARHVKPRFSVGVVARLLAVAAVALTGQSAWGAVIEGLEVVSSPQDEWYAAGDEIRIRATFDEAVRVQHSPRLKLRVNIGGNQRYATLSNDRPASAFTFAYRVQDGDSDVDGIEVDMPAFIEGSFVDQDDDTNVNVATTTLMMLPDHKVDGVAPTAAAVPAVVSDPGVDNTYAIGDVIEIEVGFDEEVRVSGNPELILSIGRTGATPPTGPLSRRATLSRIRPERLVFRYVVQAGDGVDTDGIEIRSDALTGGVIEDLRGNPARREFTAPPYANHRVDAEAPSVVGVEIASSPASGNTYGLGEVIEVRLTFDQVVFISPDPRPAGQPPRLALDIGAGQRYANYATGSGTRTIAFRYTVAATDQDDDGISIGPDALDDGTVEDRNGNEYNRRIVPVREQPNHRVNGNTTNPTATGVAFATSGRSDGYRTGDNIDLNVSFNVPVFVREPREPDEDTELRLILEIGGNSRYATYVGGSGTETLRFRYVVQDGDQDEDGISIRGRDALVGASIEDEDGTVAGRGFPVVTPDQRRTVNARRDEAAPLVEDVTFEPARSNQYRLGEAIEIKIDFNETVYTPGSLPVLQIAIGGNLRSATLVEGGGTDTLTFRYIVQDTDEGRVSIAPGELSLLGGTIVDGAGNAALRDFEAIDATHHVDGVPPEAGMPCVVLLANAVRCESSSREYGLGAEIFVRIRYDEPVYVTGPLQLVISIGEHSRRAAFFNGSGSEALIFRYVVQRGDRDDDGISIGPDALVGGTIEDRAGNNWGEAQRRLPPLPQEGSPTVRVGAVGGTAVIEPDGVKITERDCAAPVDCAGNEAYGAGENIEVTVEFDQKVFVTGSPSLTLQIGSTQRQASLVDGGGTYILRFRYTVQAGDYDNDGISIGAGPGALVGGTIQDESGSDVDRSFEALPADGAPRVDAVNPTVQSVSITSTPAAASTYGVGERIEVAVQFDDDVWIVNHESLALRLTIGEHIRNAAPTQSAGTTTRSLTFRYTVTRGDFDDDGISIADDALTGELNDRVGDPVDGRLDPLPNQSGHLVGAEVALGVELNLIVNGPPGVFNLYEEILVPQGIRHYTGTYLPPVSENSSVATARVSGHRLVITPHAEGTSAIVVAAEGAAITLLFAVTVQANQAEVAVLEHALAAMGRGILSSAAHTIGARLETKKRNPLARYGQRIRVLPDPALGNTPQNMGVGHVQAFEPGWQTGTGGVFGAVHSPWQGAEPWQGTGRRTPRQGAFEMPLIGGVSRDTAWALWGAGDFSAFEGEPESARFEGDLTAAYVGVDARGEGWLAGAAVGRVDGDADYQFTVDERTSKGNMETTLTVVNPYVQWSLGERGRMWAMVGVGNGEVSIKREDRASPAKPTDLTMRMGMAGLRTEIATAGNFRFALRGDVGSVQLETDDGATALHGLDVNVQRARAGVETSFPLVSPDGGELTPFVDIGARYDSGDGQTGTGAEVAVGMRASGGALRFEAKARTLVMQGEEDYSETGASATVIVEPGSNGKGLRLSLSPRWGGADDSMDVFWQRDRGNGLQAFKREMERGWGVAGRVDYGMAVNGRRGNAATVRPFGEVDVVDDDNQRLRVGMAYELESDADRPLKFEISSERVEREVGTEQRYLLSAEGRF